MAEENDVYEYLLSQKREIVKEAMNRAKRLRKHRPIPQKGQLYLISVTPLEPSERIRQVARGGP